MEQTILIALVSVAGGVVAALAYQNYLKKGTSQKEDQSKPKESDTNAKEIILEAKDEAFRIKKEAEERACPVQRPPRHEQRAIERR